MADVKPDISAEFMTLTLRTQTGDETMFKVKPTMKVCKILEAFAKRKGIDKEAVKLVFDGKQLNSEQTFAEQDLEDQDCIEVVLNQTGGAR